MKKPYLETITFVVYANDYKFRLDWFPTRYHIDFYVFYKSWDIEPTLLKSEFREYHKKPTINNAKAFFKKDSPLWTWFEDYQKALTDKYRPLYIQQFRRVARLAYANLTKQEAKNLVQEAREWFARRVQEKKSWDDIPPFFTWNDDELLKVMQFKISPPLY